MRVFPVIGILLFLALAPVSAQTNTPNPDAAIYATLESGQLTRFEYTATAADVQISAMLILILVSLWAMFLIYIFVVWRVDRR